MPLMKPGMHSPDYLAAPLFVGNVRRYTEKELDDADDLYLRLESLSKSLEGAGRIDEHDNPDAYATVLDAMNFVNARRGG